MLHKGGHLRDQLQNFFQGWIQVIYISKEFCLICRVKNTTQEILKCFLWFWTTGTHRFYHIIEVIYVHLDGWNSIPSKLVSNFTPLVSRFAKTVFYLSPMKLRALDPNLVTESILQISLLSVLHSLVQCGKKMKFQMIYFLLEKFRFLLNWRWRWVSSFVAAWV